MQTSPRYHNESIEREEVISAAFQFENDQVPYIIYDVNYWLFGELQEKIPLSYCSEDPSEMVQYQLAKITSSCCGKNILRI